MGNRTINISLIAVTLFIVIATAQPQPPDTLWTRTYGGSNDDCGYRVKQTYDNGFLVVGYTMSFGNGSADAYLIYVDSLGNSVWEQFHGGLYSDVANGIQVDSSGYVISGYNMYSGSGDKDLWLFRTNLYGDLVWNKSYGFDNQEQAIQIANTYDYGYIIVGITNSIGSGGYDIWLLKTNSEGDTLWTRTYGGSDDDMGYGVHQTFDGGYIISGNTLSFGAGGSDVYLLKTDEFGILEWSNTYGGSFDDHGTRVRQTSDGGFILTGLTNSFSVGGADIWVIKTDQLGDTVWTKTFGGVQDDWGNCIRQTSDNGYIISGWTESFGAGGRDIWIIKLDELGNEVWNKTMGGADSDYSIHVEQNNDNSYIVSGLTSSFGAGDYDVYLIRLEGPPIYISNINSLQLSTPSQLIKTGYTLVHSEYLPCSITIQISEDGGLTWDVPATSAWGDIGPNISPGTGKTIYWNAGLDYPNQFNENMRIKIIADDQQ